MCVFRLFSLFWLMVCSIISPADLSENAKVLVDMGMGNTYFVLLPKELCDHIAYFVGRETDEEFIARASKQKEISEELRTRVLNSRTSGHTHFTYGPGLLSYSVNGQKLYRVREELAMYGQLPHSQITKISLIKSFDVKTFEYEDLSDRFDKMFNFFLDIKCFAISGDEKQLAQLIRHHDDDHLIVCRKIGETKPYQTFVIPEKYKAFISIGFNKQSTKIIMFTREALGHPIGESTSPAPDPIKHTLFSLVPESEHEKSSQKTLVGYFAWLIEKYGNQ
jgi:hypothetical protein